MSSNQLPIRRYNNLEKLRNQLNLSQEELAERIGIDIKTYRQYEKLKNTGTTALQAIWEYFNDPEKGNIPVSLDYIMGYTDCRSVDNDYISNVTGLSDKSIERLKGYNLFRDNGYMPRNFIHIIDDILSVKTSSILEDFLSCIFDYIYSGAYQPITEDTNEFKSAPLGYNSYEEWQNYGAPTSYPLKLSRIGHPFTQVLMIDNTFLQTHAYTKLKSVLDQYIVESEYNRAEQSESLGFMDAKTAKKIKSDAIKKREVYINQRDINTMEYNDI